MFNRTKTIFCLLSKKNFKYICVIIIFASPAEKSFYFHLIIESNFSHWQSKSFSAIPLKRLICNLSPSLYIVFYTPPIAATRFRNWNIILSDIDARFLRRPQPHNPLFFSPGHLTTSQPSLYAPYNPLKNTQEHPTIQHHPIPAICRRGA